MPNEEFYIGYLDKAPPGTRSFLRRLVVLLIVVGIVCSAVIVVSQQPFYPSTFEFLQYRTFEGTLQEQPYPMLRVLRPGATGTLPAYSHFYLVNEGKFGVQDDVAGLDGQRIRLEGALIYRDDQVMVELKPGTLEVIDAKKTSAAPERSLGTFTLTGEIVDSKCFLGVMNPGSLKPHRACAARCISGGVPPLFYVTGTNGEHHHFMLVDAEGQPVNQAVLDVVAEPLEITGEVVQQGDVLTLKANPATFVRLAP